MVFEISVVTDKALLATMRHGKGNWVAYESADGALVFSRYDEQTGPPPLVASHDTASYTIVGVVDTATGIVVRGLYPGAIVTMFEPITETDRVIVVDAVRGGRDGIAIVDAAGITWDDESFGLAM